MKRIKTEFLALVFAATTTALFAGPLSSSNCMDSSYLTMSQARAESAIFLGAAPTQARLDQGTERWAVSDGQTTAWLDARSGELLEVEFKPSR